VILRHESWGAWVKLESMPAVIALDHDGVRALGVDVPAEADARVRPIEVHLAVTGQCGAGCEGCYLDARPDGAHVAREELTRTFAALERAGVFTVAFGGGEPTLRDDLGELAEEARAHALTPVLTTSGIGLTAARIERLSAFAQVNVSYDGPSAEYEAVRGFDGAAAAERALGLLREAGIRIGVNVVLTRDTFDQLEAIVDRAQALGAVEAQLLRYKPAGRAARLDYLAKRLSRDQVLRLPGVLRKLSEKYAGTFRLRVDCAMVPFLSSDEEVCADPSRLDRLGILGCVAGDTLAAIEKTGFLAPCSFLPKSSQRGDSVDEGLHDAAFEPLRRYAESPDAPCDACPLRRSCRGGCKVVSTYLDGRIGPDPECPRVVAQREKVPS
jgi:radical SAM protein with 4Fe4S-binding SPASM domain